MPFVKRRIEPSSIRRNNNVKDKLFEEYTDVANNAMVNTLLQLASLTFHAEDIFRELEGESKSLFQRFQRVGERIQRMQETTRRLDHKAVQIPVSDMDTEFKFPLHLQYRSGDSVEEDLFTPDSQTPCLIHLHQLTRSDLNGVLRGDQTYAKPQRPKSFDPNILLDEKTNSATVLPSKSTVNISNSSDPVDLYAPKSFLPTPQQKIELESARHHAQVITVDTSGSQFDRRVNFRRSQRSSVAVGRKMKFKERHKTLTALPDYVSSELGLPTMRRQNSLHSEVNSTSSFLGDGSIASGDSSLSPRDHASQSANPNLFPTSPIRRRLKNRQSMSAVMSVPASPLSGARVSLKNTPTGAMSTFPRNQRESQCNEAEPQTNGYLPAAVELGPDHKPFMRDKNNAAEDRISSGFWSGTESCRHSTTSEILTPHNNAAPSQQQLIQAKQLDANKQGANDNDTSASSLSLNSRLSTFEPSSKSSSFVSLTQTPDDSTYIHRSEPVTPRQLNFSTPDGAYNFMNQDYVDPYPAFAHAASPPNLLVLGSRRGSDGRIKEELESFDSSAYSHRANASASSEWRDDHSRQVNSYPSNSVFSPEPLHTANSNAIHPTSSSVSTNQERFFGNDFPSRDTRHSQRSNSSVAVDFQSELKARLQRDKPADDTSKKPPPPRRQSSLKLRPSEASEVRAYMEPLSSPGNHQKTPPPYPTAQGSLASPRPEPAPLSSNGSRSSGSSLPESSDISNGSSPITSPRYQPSKTVAFCLQSKRPVTKYDFHQISASPTTPVNRPISIVEPITKSPPSPSFNSTSEVPSDQKANSAPERKTYSVPSPFICHASVSSSPSKPPTAAEVKKFPAANDEPSLSTMTITATQLKAASSSLTRVSSSKSHIDDPPKVEISLADKWLSDPGEKRVLSPINNHTSSSNPEPMVQVQSSTSACVSPVSPSKANLAVNNDSKPEEVQKKTSPVKPPVAAKPKMAPGKKPPIRPKPAVQPRPVTKPVAPTNGESELERRFSKSRQVKKDNASLRAAFFAKTPSADDPTLTETKPGVDLAKAGETVETTEVAGCEPSGKTMSNESANDRASVHEVPFETSEKEEQLSSRSEKPVAPPNDCVQRENGTAAVEVRTDDLEDTKKPPKDENEEEEVKKPIEEVAVKPQEQSPPAELSICNGVDTRQNHAEVMNGSDVIADVFDSPLPSSTTFDFKSSLHRLRSSNSTTSVDSGLKSPMSPLNVERRSNTRYSTSSLDRRRKANSGSTSREDFKALLLQNLSKSGSGSQMSATEKLQMSMQRPDRSSTNGEDVADGSPDQSRSNIVSMGDIRAAMSTSRPGRRPNRMPDHRRSYAGSPGVQNKKHPPISMSGRYCTRSRTPTRPMMAIREDSESESTEKADDLRRPKSVGHF